MNNALDSVGSLAEVTYNDASDIEAAAALAARSDVAIVMVGDISREGVDRSDLALPHTDGVDQDALVSAVAAANANTVVVLKNGGPVLLPWLDEVPAVLEAWYPAQEDGNIVGNLLVGLENPSGKLPITFPTQEREGATATVEQWPGIDPDGSGPLPLTATYSEGLEMGYRWYDANDVAPTFAFGYGLSYTSFALSNVTVTPGSNDGTAPVEVSFSVKNTGEVRGAEVGQVYLGLPDEANQPPKRLVGFDKVTLNPGESKRVSVTIDPAASNHPLSVWDEDADGWKIVEGEYSVLIGNASNNITLEDSFTISGPPFDIATEASTRTLAGKAYVTATVINNGEIPLDVVLSTPYGDKKFTAVQPGKKASVSINSTSASIPSGTVTATVSGTVDGELVTYTSTADYAAAG
ncbi:hypothetical protein ET475_07745 [Microbacterium protaetiae]|uniref:Fibronectin type III-like domain-containing protein n=1 Tax=Microbacterium protaetiae TaxID=2509458 RepID=A0A4P6ECE2_9MICO|nr:hypothetical protein ET475_07745 [Microbacterium protaetiae]